MTNMSQIWTNICCANTVHYVKTKKNTVDIVEIEQQTSEGAVVFDIWLSVCFSSGSRLV